MTHDESSSKVKIVTILISIALVIGVINLLGTYALNNKINALGSGAAIAQPGQPVPNQPAAKVEVSADDDPVLGDKKAPVTIVEFSDFGCYYCNKFHLETFDQIKTKYIDTGKVKFVYRDFPIAGLHPNAPKASEAAECADEQGKFWEMHNELFAIYSTLSVENSKKIAANLGLDTAKFNDCLDSGKMAEEVNKDITDGSKAGVRGTPGFFVNGNPLVGAQPFVAFEQLIEAELAK